MRNFLHKDSLAESRFWQLRQNRPERTSDTAKQKRTDQTNQALFADEEIADPLEKFLAIEGPNEKSFGRLYAFIQRYFSPTIVGLDKIPDEPTLFIGNHAMFGLDGMILMPTVYQETGRKQTSDSVETLVSDMLLMRAQNKHNEGRIRRLLTR
jgi:hypothetical protein